MHVLVDIGVLPFPCDGLESNHWQVQVTCLLVCVLPPLAVVLEVNTAPVQAMVL
jgi:hypothetical protein